MNAWKPIFAALVIFAAGVVTGGLTVRLKLREVPTPPPGPGFNSPGFGGLRQRGLLLDRMQRQLYLSAAQREHIDQILRDNHEHMRQLWDSIAPKARQEQRRVRELILAELTPEQRKRFEEVFKPHNGSFAPGDEHRRREEWRGDSKSPASSTNSTNSTPQRAPQ